MSSKLIPKNQVGGAVPLVSPFQRLLDTKAFLWFRTPKDYSDEKAGTTNCSEYSNKELRKMGKNVWGDAWTRSNNKVKKIYSGYDGLNRPKEYNKDDVLDYLYSAADNVQKNLDLNSLQTGDIVGLYFKGSPNLEKAFNNGANKEAQTHTGHIVVEDGVPYVVHNVHGNVIKNKAKQVLGHNRPYGIVSVYRP